MTLGQFNLIYIRRSAVVMVHRFLKVKKNNSLSHEDRDRETNRQRDKQTERQTDRGANFFLSKSKEKQIFESIRQREK